MLHDWFLEVSLFMAVFPAFTVLDTQEALGICYGKVYLFEIFCAVYFLHIYKHIPLLNTTIRVPNTRLSKW